MPRTTIIDMPPAEQAQMRAELHRARYGYLLALHILLLCAAQRTPTEIAGVLFCSRTTVYRVVKAYRTGQWDRLAAALRRIEFVLLRTDSSPPVAPYPASRRRSYLQLRSCGLL